MVAPSLIWSGHRKPCACPPSLPLAVRLSVPSRPCPPSWACCGRVHLCEYMCARAVRVYMCVRVCASQACSPECCLCTAGQARHGQAPQHADRFRRHVAGLRPHIVWSHLRQQWRGRRLWEGGSNVSGVPRAESVCGPGVCNAYACTCACLCVHACVRVCAFVCVCTAEMSLEGNMA